VVIGPVESGQLACKIDAVSRTDIFILYLLFVEAEFIAPGEAETAAALDEIEVKPRPKGNSGIKPCDYPEFDGRGDGWFVWRLEYEATAEMAGMKDVLNVVDSTDHLKKRLDDHQYDDAVTYQFSMLKKKTSKGTALAKVKKYDVTRDGALAWLDLKQYYNQEGDKKTYGAECLKSLVTLTLEHANRGGMDDYINRFELIIDQLQESDQPLTEDQKKVFFLKGIQDHSYSNTRDLCQPPTVTFMGCMKMMKQKSNEFNKFHTPGQESYDQNQIRRGNGTQKRFHNTNRKFNYADTKGGSPSYG
jgi:hypothetical protein